MRTSPAAAIHAGLDMGGTHTDAAAVLCGPDGARLVGAVKVPTDHEDPADSVRRALEALFREVAPDAVVRLTVGTTLCVNAAVRGTHDVPALALTAGPGMDPHEAGIGPYTDVIPGGLDHRGEELVPLDEDAARCAVRRRLDQGLTAFACAGKFSPRNPAHELALARVLQQECARRGLEDPAPSLGHALAGSLNFPRRAAGAWWNAALRRTHNAFLDAVDTALARCGVAVPVRLLRADGGAVPAAACRNAALHTLISGPAASVMGAAALCPGTGDVLVLDVGGTTTDIALLADGVPVLAPDGLRLQGRLLPVRSVASVSVGFGGDSLLRVARRPDGTLVADAGPERHGPALAFGGTRPTLLDALNLSGLACAGRVEASRAGIAALAASVGCTPAEAAASALKTGLGRVVQAVRALLDEVNGRPVHTLAALLEHRRITPVRVVTAGGPAAILAPLLEQALGLPAATVPGGEAAAGVLNALGAALTRPSLGLELFADTLTGRLTIRMPDGGGDPVCGTADRSWTLEQARNEACNRLRAAAARLAPDDAADIDVLEARLFALLDERGRSGRDLRVRCRLRPGLLGSVSFQSLFSD